MIQQLNKIDIINGKFIADPAYWSLAFTGHTNIEKCYDEKQLPFGCSYNCVIINGIGDDSANKAYMQIKKAIEKFIEMTPGREKVIKWGEIPDPENPGFMKLICLDESYSGKRPRIIVGMARGVDEIAGLVAMDMGLDIICCVPHSISWHQNRQPTNKGRVQALFYERFLNYPKAFWFEIKKTYSSGWPFANFARNAFMVDLADKVLSFKCYDSAGTDHCIKYAKSQNKYAGNIPKD